MPKKNTGAKFQKPKNMGGDASGSFLNRVHNYFFGGVRDKARKVGRQTGKSLINMHKRK